MGSAEALFNLAEQAFYGGGFAVNPALAIDYYEQAFEAGIPCAAQALGSLYERGDESVIADHGKAISWYKRGAVEHDAMACFLLGRLFWIRHQLSMIPRLASIGCSGLR